MTSSSPPLVLGPVFLIPSREAGRASAQDCGVTAARQRRTWCVAGEPWGGRLLYSQVRGAPGACAARGPLAVCLPPPPAWGRPSLRSGRALCALALLIVTAGTYPSFPVRQGPRQALGTNKCATLRSSPGLCSQERWEVVRLARCRGLGCRPSAPAVSPGLVRKEGFSQGPRGRVSGCPWPHTWGGCVRSCTKRLGAAVLLSRRDPHLHVRGLLDPALEPQALLVPSWDLTPLVVAAAGVAERAGHVGLFAAFGPPGP